MLKIGDLVRVKNHPNINSDYYGEYGKVVGTTDVARPIRVEARWKPMPDNDIYIFNFKPEELQKIKKEKLFKNQ